MISGLHNNKIQHDLSSTIKRFEETDTFSNTGPHKVPHVLSRYQYSPLVARHTSERYSFSCQVLTSISLTHPAALAILSRDSFTFCTFSR